MLWRIWSLATAVQTVWVVLTLLPVQRAWQPRTMEDYWCLPGFNWWLYIKTRRDRAEMSWRRLLKLSRQVFQSCVTWLYQKAFLYQCSVWVLSSTMMQEDVLRFFSAWSTMSRYVRPMHRKKNPKSQSVNQQLHPLYHQSCIRTGLPGYCTMIRLRCGIILHLCTLEHWKIYRTTLVSQDASITEEPQTSTSVVVLVLNASTLLVLCQLMIPQ